VTDATILIPTFRHAQLLPFAIASALAQEGASVEVFVVGDGVEDDTRAAVSEFGPDPRLRFFDNPKGERHGEAHRHGALQEASGWFVTYLSDDDLLLPDHVTAMGELLAAADFAHSAPFYVSPSGGLGFKPVDLAEPVYHRLMLAGWSPVGLTGASHRLEAYRRLPHGWRPAPTGIWTDLYMWQQFLALPGLRAATARQITALHFADQHRQQVHPAQRVAELADWHQRSRRPGFREELAGLAYAAVWEAAVGLEARVVLESQAGDLRHRRLRWRR